MKRSFLVFSLFCMFLAVTPLHAQEVRATLTGRVTDPTGAIIPGAHIVAMQTDTGTSTTTTANSAGTYTIPFLAPGPYSLSVTAPGFQTYIHKGLVLQTEETVTENAQLAVGQTTETVTVQGGTPLVDVANATTGQVLTSQEVEDLPSNGRSPIGFGHIMYGAVAKGKHSASQVRPFDNSTGSDFSIAGGNSQSNEILLNGVPNMEDGARISGYSPNLDAVDSIRIDEFSANVALGDTSGGIFNVNTKSGTNVFHGSAEEYYSGSRPLTANPFTQPAGTQAASVHFNQFGGTIGGPIRIPHVFNGQDKLFFFYAFEGYIGKSPATVVESVPTAAERNGDFSALLALNSSTKNYQLYNPYTATLAGTTVTRQPIPNNCLVATCGTLAGAGLTLDPVAQAYLKMMPMPNYGGASADGENNYFASDPTINNYKSNQAQIDWNISTSNKIKFEAHRSNYLETSGQTFFNDLTGTTSDTILWGGQADDVQTFSPSLTFESRLGFSRYVTDSEPTSQGVNPSTVGMPPYVSSNSTLFALPNMTFSDASTIQALSGSPGSTEEFDTIQLFGVLTKIAGRHTIKLGFDLRSYKESNLSPGAADGAFAFKAGSGDFVTSGTTGASQAFGGAFALFDLGLPNSSSSYNVATKFQYDSWYGAYFAQDDWKLLPNFTVSAGLRVDHETPDVESNNHLVAGFVPGAANASTAAAEANYSSQYAGDSSSLVGATPPNPLGAADLPSTSSFTPTGNVIYATPSNRSAYKTATAYVSPRIGFAYAPGFGHGTLAIRGGFAIYVNPWTDYSNNWGPSYGFTQSTSFVPTTNNYLSPATTLSNPFPTAMTSLGGPPNPIVQPYGSAYGVNTQLGSSITYYYGPVKIPYSEHFTLDIQKQIGKSWLFESSYVGDHQVHNYANLAQSSTPLLPYLSRSPILDQTVTAALGGSITNPFLNTMPASTTGPAATTGLNTSSKTTVAAMLQAYPEYTSVTKGLDPIESGNFNSILFKIQKNMSHGLQFEFNYIYSRNLGATMFENPGGNLWYGETSSDFPEHASVTAIYLLPFGRGRTFFNQSRVADEVIGGWQVTGIYQFLSGTPLSWGNVDYTGDYSGFNNHPHQYLKPTFNTAGFNTISAQQPNSYNFRTFPQLLLRSDPTNNFDFSLLKNFTLWERLVLQPRLDAFNALNRPQFGSASTSVTSSAFAEANSQLNTSRQLQVGVHLLF